MSFDRLAVHYAWMERFLAGNLLQECRLAFLDQVRSARRVLLCGEGHGRFLERAVAANPAAEFVVIEASRKMNDVASRRLERSGVPAKQIRFVTSPVLAAPELSACDLLVTNFFLDCFEGDQLAATVLRLRGMLGSGGRWIVSDFQAPREGWRRVRARAVLFLAYRFFRVATGLPARRLEPPAELIAREGLQLDERREFNHGLLYSELWTDPPANGSAKGSP